jgi:hypothetical protein
VAAATCILRVSIAFLEVLDEVCEGRKFKQMLPRWGLVDGLMLQHPGKVVGKKDSV